MDEDQKKEFEEKLGKKHFTDLLPRNPDGWEPTEQYLRRVMQVLLEYINTQSDRNSKVLNFLHPEDLKSQFDFSIPDEPVELGRLIKDCEDTLKHQVKTGHPRFYNQISCGLDMVCMSGEWLTATANTNMFTYEVAPVFTLMERELLNKMIEMVGWPEGDGIFAPGGSISNLYAVNAARHHLMPRCKPLGMGECPRMCMFTSEESHYSIRGAAAVTGIGTDLCFYVPVDSAGRMVPEALEQKIIESKREGLMPFFVSATAGTTVYGAFDPMNQIADICQRHNMWMHVDAAWGGGLLLSKKHRHLHSGIERAQSVTWNPHKLMGALLQCSVILIRREGLLFETNQMSADYLFQQDKPYDVTYDTGDKAMQCGRHNDVFKLWLMWRSKGTNGFEAQVDHLMELAAYFTERVRNTPGFELVIEDPKFLNICFWYIPPSMQQLDRKEQMARLDKVAPKIKAGMMTRGTTMVGYQPDEFQHRPNFFRMIISNQAMTKADLDFLIDEIIDIAKNM